jgi:hypothetical protein
MESNTPLAYSSSPLQEISSGLGHWYQELFRFLCSHVAQLGITPQKPLWRAYQQDPERVRQWVEEEYPSIAREAKQLGAEIWFGAESGRRRLAGG